MIIYRQTENNHKRSIFMNGDTISRNIEIFSFLFSFSYISLIDLNFHVEYNIFLDEHPIK